MMEWVKLYTTFHDHRKTVELDTNAIRLWTLYLSWSGAQETDGFVPRCIALALLAGELGDEAVARLVRVGLWEPVEGEQPDASPALAPDLERVELSGELTSAARGPTWTGGDSNP